MDSYYFGCYEDEDEYIYGAYLIENNLMTDGSPTGTPKTLDFATEGQITVHSATAQVLDNSHVRYTVEYTVSAGRTISFFDPPNGERFMRVDYLITTGDRGVFTVDIPKADSDAVTNITMKFFLSDMDNNSAAWVFLAPARF